MKKLTKIIPLMISIIFILTISSLAASFSVKTDVEKQDDYYTLKLSLNEVGVSGNGINAFICDIEYDRNSFEELKKEDITLQNGWEDLTYNPAKGTILTLRNDFTKKQGEEILEVKLHPKASAKNKTEIKVTNLQASNSQIDLEADDQVIELSLNGKSSILKTILIIAVVIVILLVVIRIIAVKKQKRRRRR